MKPTPRQLLALRGLRDTLALGGKAVNAFSPFWAPLRRRNWVALDGTLTGDGEMVANNYQTVILTCHFCDSRVAEYVAEIGVEKTLNRTCRVCGTRQRFVVKGDTYEVVGDRET